MPSSLVRSSEQGQILRRLVKTMARIIQCGTVAVAPPLNLAKQVRGRRKMLATLISALESRDVTQLDLECGWVQVDWADIDIVYALRNRKMNPHVSLAPSDALEKALGLAPASPQVQQP